MRQKPLYVLIANFSFFFIVDWFRTTTDGLFGEHLPRFGSIFKLKRKYSKVEIPLLFDEPINSKEMITGGTW